MFNVILSRRRSAVDLQRSRSAGVTIVESLVAFSLLTTVLAASTPLLVRHGRLLASARHYRLALEEVANQIERLAALPEADVRAALESLEASPFTAERLQGAKLTGTLEDGQLGARLTVRIVWDEMLQRGAPLALTAWLAPQGVGPADDVERREDQP